MSLTAKLTILFLVGMVLSACTAAPSPTPTTQPNIAASPSATHTIAATSTSQPSGTPMPFELSSPAFEPGGVIPDVYSCKGGDISPELVWGDPPAGTLSLALIFDDPSGPWTHWVAYNLSASAGGLPEAVPAGEDLPGGGSHGANSWGALEYSGPCPPQGSTHTYIFTLYALDTLLDLEPGANNRELVTAMEGHILAEVELSANFTR